MRMTRWWKALGALAIGAAALLLEAGPAAAADEKLMLELKARMDRLEKENKELEQKLQSKPIQISGTVPAAPAAPVDVEKERINKQVDAYLKQKDDKKKAEEKAKKDQEEAEGYKVGSQFGMTVRWNPDQG